MGKIDHNLPSTWVHNPECAFVHLIQGFYDMMQCGNFNLAAENILAANSLVWLSDAFILSESARLEALLILVDTEYDMDFLPAPYYRDGCYFFCLN